MIMCILCSSGDVVDMDFSPIGYGVLCSWISTAAVIGNFIFFFKKCLH